MQCPACGDPQIILELHSVEIDFCVACRGVWLDDGETQLIAQAAGGEPSVLSGLLSGPKQGDKSGRNCPRCSKPLRLTPAGPVELCGCPDGHGYFFDPGELHQLLHGDEVPGVTAVARFLREILGDAPQPKA